MVKCNHPMCPRGRNLTDRRIARNPAKTLHMKSLERIYSKDIDSIIVDSFIENDGHLFDAGNSIGVDYSTLSRWIARRGLTKKIETIKVNYPNPNSRNGRRLTRSRREDLKKISN